LYQYLFLDFAIINTPPEWKDIEEHVAKHKEDWFDMDRLAPVDIFQLGTVFYELMKNQSFLLDIWRKFKQVDDDDLYSVLLK